MELVNFSAPVIDASPFAAADGYQRIALGVEYCGADFNGWQRQAHTGNTVQAVLESALQKIATYPVQLICAGRTDAAVHGFGQVVHFDLPESINRGLHAWVRGGNHHLPEEIAVLWACAVPADFHARFSARYRSYVYVLLNRPARSAVLGRRVTWEQRPLDVEAMHHAAQVLLGEHDFSAFRASSCQSRSRQRQMMRLDVERRGPFVLFHVTANAFLHHMVRNLVGTLLDVGRGDKPTEWVAEVLASRDRGQAGVTAKPHGLYLAHVGYDDHWQLPKPSGGGVAEFLGVGVNSTGL